jgi:hypothetical protein
MMKAMKFLAVRGMALLALLLVGCATPYDALRNYSGADSGTVVASVGMTSANTMNYVMVEFRRKNANDLGLLEFSPRAASAFGGTPVDFAGPAGPATLVKRRLPPGEYEIIGYMSGSNYGSSMVWINAPRDFSIPFSVKSGELVYLGQYLVGLNLIDGRPSSSFLTIANERQRDLTKMGVTDPSAVRSEAEAIVQGAVSGIRRLN